MKPEDIEKALKEARLSHLTEDWLVLYRDHQLDDVRTALADAHLKLCLLCKSRLTALAEDKAALDDARPDSNDIAFVRQAIQRWGPRPSESDMEITKPPPRSALIDKLAEYLREMAASWRAQFIVPVVREPRTGKEIWKWQNSDGTLKGRAVMNKDGSVTIELSATEPEWKNAPLRVKLGRFTKEVVLAQSPGSEIRAEVEVPRSQRPKSLGGISIELIR